MNREQPRAMQPTGLQIFGFVVLVAVVLATGFGAIGATAIF